MPSNGGDKEVTERHRRPQAKAQPLPMPFAVTRNDQMKAFAKKYRTELSAGSASLTSTLLSFPLDTIKTRVQTFNFKSLADCALQTYREEKLTGFWRGVLSPLASIALVRTISFSIYQQSKYTYDEWIFKATGKSPLVTANTLGAYPTFGTLTCFAAAGATAGAAITVVACPFELTKTAQQLSQLMTNKPRSGTDMEVAASYRNKGTWDTAKQLVRNRGWGGLYAGFTYHLIRDTIGTGVYFMTYESMKQLLATSRGDAPTSPKAIVVAGAVCGLVSWASIFPIDTAKVRYQRNCLIQVKGKTESTSIKFFNKGNYRGLGISMGRSAVVNAIFFSTFEYTKKVINELEINNT